MEKLSAVIIASNEERNIERCVLSLKPVADEILIYLNNSHDRTAELARSTGVTLVFGPWSGYSETKNSANAAARYDWILSLDADEALSPELQQQLIQWKNNPVNASFSRLTNYCGTFIRHCGWYPEFKWRLFNRKVTRWEGSIHEHLKLQDGSSPRIARLSGDCYHYSYYSTEEHLNQSTKFAKLAADDLFRRGKRSTFIKRMLGPSIKFISMYILKLGFLDGKAGYRVCRISAEAIRMREQFLSQLSARHAHSG